MQCLWNDNGNDLDYENDLDHDHDKDHDYSQVDDQDICRIKLEKYLILV